MNKEEIFEYVQKKYGTIARIMFCIGYGSETRPDSAVD